MYLCLSFYFGVNSWGNLTSIKNDFYPNDLKLLLVFSFIYNQLSIIISLVILYNLFKHSNILNLTKYTYEEFKQKRIEYKQNKLNAKKEKLKKQLEEIEKTE